MAKGWRKHESDWSNPLTVEVQATKEEPEWHARAREMREQGYSYQAIADEVGRCRAVVTRYLDPELRKRLKKDQNEREKRKRLQDPEYAEKIRSYVRRYMQLASGGRNKS